ncbi:hypothetical protein EDD30_7710 [Couchioplanes caeruleus]|uniref:NUDIX hydrolase n=1 Tax=Couchioplanes caeruleus TaxID=56438 RepID=A0A3N1FTQ1_9ACTN|nr:hypothetical protein [Couchioplanes caeruleus]ROP21309.1 hypothetical protein EDD30_7710 [Couchioplanes caeruleus]
MRVFGNRFGELFNDAVVSAAGVAGTYLRWRWRSAGVIVLPVHAGDIALVPAYRYLIGDVSLSFPAGRSTPAKPCARPPSGSCAKRLAASTQMLGEVYAETGLIESSCAVVRVDVRAAVMARPEAMESVAAPRWLSSGDTRQAIVSGEIRCGLTLAALALYLASPVGHQPAGLER